MEIYIKESQAKVSELAIGDVFIYETLPYIRVAQQEKFNSVEMFTGKFANIPTEVYVRKAKKVVVKL